MGLLEYEVKGKGPDVLFFHGGHSNCYETLGVNSLVESGFRLIVPSRPGYGNTSVNLGKTPEEFADSVINIMIDQDIDRAHVIGVSAGSPSALTFASKYPDRVGKLVLESAITKSWIEKCDKQYKVARVIFSPLMQSFTWNMLRFFGNLFPRYIAKQFIPSFSKLKADEVLNILDKKEIEEIRLMNNRYSSGKGFMLDIEHRIDCEVLNLIKSETLVVHSRNDGSVDFSHAEYAASNIQKCELYESKAWGHLIWLGQEGIRVNEKIVQFLLKADK
jgi:pimeloyl-ACP methyl ester carboxylesterase